MTALTERPTAATRFTVPPGAEAVAPPEHRGLARDEVRLLVSRDTGVAHRRFRDLPEQLEPGDLVVVNTSGTLPAALTAHLAGGRPAPLHVSGELDNGSWVVEVRRADRAGPDLARAAGDRLDLPAGVCLQLLEPYPAQVPPGRTRLWRAAVTPVVSRAAYLARHGAPIRYRYLTGDYPLAAYQNVYATQPGSAEMASAGRPFTAELLVRLIARGVPVVPVVLHAGVSSPERHEPPSPERFEMPEVTARLVNSTRSAGRNVVAVGTTVVRAVESAAGADGIVRAAAGWTDLVLGPDRPARAITGLISGLHDPEASHLLLLEAVAGPAIVSAAYAAAVEQRYLWHEFGDSTLLLP